MRNPQNSLRFYIDQADDKAVIRAVPVKPIAAAPRASAVAAAAEAVNEAAETKQVTSIATRSHFRERVASARVSRVSRLVHRGRKHS